MSKITLKKSAVTGKVPVVGDLDFGEIAINYADGILYYKNSVGSIGILNGAAAVSSFNTRTGAVTLNSSDVTTALGFTPYNSSNPNGYITSSALSPYLTTATANSTYLPRAGGNMTGSITLTGGSNFVLRSAAGAVEPGHFIWENSAGTEIHSLWTDTGGLYYRAGPLDTSKILLHSGNYTTYSPSRDGTSAYGTWSISITGNAATVTSITSSQVTTALGFTPYNSTNPNGYTSNTGTVTSVSGTGTVSGLTLTGTVTGSGSLTLGGAITGFLPLAAGTSNMLTSELVRSASGGVDGTYLTVLRYGTPGDLQSGTAAANRWIGLDATVTAGAAVSNVLRVRAYGGGTGNAVPVNVVDFRGDQTSNFYGAILQSGNQVLHAGNYTSYSPSLTGSGASGTWGINVTGTSNYSTTSGSASTATRSTIEDTRAAQRIPNAYDDYRASYEFTNQITGLGDWHTAFTMQGWHDGYAAWQIIGPASSSAHENWYLRSGVNTTWNSLRTILHSGNYSSYALPLSGGALSGSITLGSFLKIATDNSDWGTGNYFRGAANHFVLGVQSGGTLYLNYGNEAGTTRISGTTLINGNQVLHAGNYSSYALPLSGGTVSGTVRINSQLQVGQNTNGTAIIDAFGGIARFGRDSTSYGLELDGNNYATLRNANGYLQIGPLNTSHSHFQTDRGSFYFNRDVYVDGQLYRYSGSLPYLHSGNYSSYALPLSGGTMSGAILMQGVQRITNAGYAGIEYWNNGTWQVYIGSESNAGGSRFNSANGVHTWYNNSTQAMQLSGSNLNIVGTLTAATKSFLIPHPTKPGMQLQYGSLEGPENGVYVRGKLVASNTIHLPDYWLKLVDPNTITVTLTPVGKSQNLWVGSIENNVIVIEGSENINCHYVVYAERVDVAKLKVEFYD